MTADTDEGYIKTATHNYVSRQAKVENPAKVELKGKSVLRPGVTVRGDLAVIRMGRYCFIDEHSELSPAPLSILRCISSHIQTMEAHEAYAHSPCCVGLLSVWREVA